MPYFPKSYLLTPGPTMIPPAVTEARAKQLPHHRTPQFKEIIQRIHQQLKLVFKTSNEIYSISASGSGAMEASIASLLSPGDTAICIDGGKFGQRWVELCKNYALNVVTIEVERGATVDAAIVAEKLTEHPECKAVFAQLCETSTGATFDIQGIGKVVANTNAVFVVDAISGLGAEELHTDEWNVDIAIGGSQKGTMLPPGLAFLSISAKAWQLSEQAKSPAYYFDLRRYRNGHASGEHPFTPAIGLYIQLEEALNMIAAETMQGVWQRHAWLASATRTGLSALGLELFAKTPSNVLTSVRKPRGVDVEKLISIMRDKLGVTIANGQAELKGEIFRIAHLGYVDRFDIITVIAALEMALQQMGYPVELGKGVLAAQKALLADPN